MSVVTLTTDFGLQDWFVGVMKGVILGINPKAQLVDITHEIPAGNIHAGAFALAAACPFFPRDTIHLVVVDPGVGTERAAIVARTKNQLFVGPDNGVLALALAKAGPVKAVHRLVNEQFFLPPLSQTFHGRDLFAPVAAHLSRGTPLREFGPKVKEYTRLDLESVREERGRVMGAVVYIDRFGNAITNLSADLPLLRTTGEAKSVRVTGWKRDIPICSFYQAVGRGKPLAVLGSAGFLEIAVNGGNAAQALNLRVGQAVFVSP